jgi:hypothetical protein
MHIRLLTWSLGLFSFCSLVGCAANRTSRSSDFDCYPYMFSGEYRSYQAPLDGVRRPIATEPPAMVDTSARRPKEETPPAPAAPIAPAPEYRTAAKEEAKQGPLPIIKDETKVVTPSLDREKLAVQPGEARKSANDLPVKVGTIKAEVGANAAGHTDNFTQVTGQLIQWRKTWRLRYAAVDAEDAFGGCVTLEGLADTSKLRDGQRVRAQGTLVLPENRLGTPRYIVKSLLILSEE